jgi:hypothetical protein
VSCVYLRELSVAREKKQVEEKQGRVLVMMLSPGTIESVLILRK